MWRPTRADLGMLIAGGGVLLWGLWQGSLPNSDDAIYADMARGAWRSGDLSVLRWQGALLFEKPPLAYALVAISGGLLGFSDLSVRLPGALCGLATLLLLPSLAEAVGLRRRAGYLAALLLMGSTTFVFHSRRVLLDPVLLLAMMSFLLLWIRASHASELPSRRWIALAAAAGVALGCAVLAKWVFVLLPGLAALTWHAIARRRVPWRAALVCAGVALAVSAPWHLLQTLPMGRSSGRSMPATTWWRGRAAAS